MRHAGAFRALSRTSSHRRALLRNLATSLILNDRLETTLPKAKELRRVVEKLVTLGKKNTLHTRRLAMQYLFAINRTDGHNAKKQTAVHRLFAEIAPRYSGRPGGYTRVIRTRKRLGDCAQLAVIEFVEGTVQKKAEKKRRVVKSSAKKSKAAAETSSAPSSADA